MVYVKFDIDILFYSSFKSLVFSDQHVELTILCEVSLLLQMNSSLSKPLKSTDLSCAQSIYIKARQVYDSNMALNYAVFKTQVKTLQFHFKAP